MRFSKRLMGVVVLACLVLAWTALPALATEDTGVGAGGVEPEEAPVPDRDEICGPEAPAVVVDNCPDRYEAPTVFRGILYPLLAVGLLVSIALFLLYLRWLPNFAQERRLAGRRGRR